MPQKRSLCARPTVSRLRRSQRLAARRQQVVGGLATTGENVIPGNKSPIQVPKSGLSAKAPCNVLDISGQERAAQGTLTPLDISALLDLEWKFQSIFQSYSERANRQYRSEESLLLLGNRVRILSWHISKRLRHLNHLMLRATDSQEIQTNIMAKGTEDLKQLCKQMREACNELNTTVKTAHPNKKSLSSSFQSMQKSLEQMDQVLSN